MSRKTFSFTKHRVSSAQVRASSPGSLSPSAPTPRLEAYIATVPVLVRKRIAAAVRKQAAELARQDADAALFLLSGPNPAPMPNPKPGVLHRPRKHSR